MVFRAPMRSRIEEVDPAAAVARGLELGLCGTGGRLDRDPGDLEEAVALTEAAYGAPAARRLRRFAAVPRDAEVWTRAPDGSYHRGRLLGGWSYDGSAAARTVDLVHVRGCRWTAAGEVPDAVLDSFSRGGLNFQRIRRA
jgi:hypothetical protein